MDDSSPRFKRTTDMSPNCVPSTNPFCEQTQNVENFMITPKRMRNHESPDNAFRRAKEISQAKAERSISGKINPIDIRSPEQEDQEARKEDEPAKNSKIEELGQR